jgi:DNA-binding transcriptional LysR family regulator
LDRIEAIRAFLAVVDEGSLVQAARRVGRSSAALTRTVAFLEADVGVQLLHRTTRTVRLSEAGERYAVACRRILADFEEANLAAAGTFAAPRGLLAVTAPVIFGTRILRPIIDAFLAEYPLVQVRYLLLDRQVSLAEEDIDVALRIAQLPDSGLIAARVGAVRRVVAAAPCYLEGRPVIRTPADLSDNDCITQSETGEKNVWTFPPRPGSMAHRNIRITSRLHVNSIESTIRSAVDGRGVIRVLSYQIDEEVRTGRLQIILADAEPTPLPVQLLAAESRLELAKVRAFVDFAVPRLKSKLQSLAA